MSEWSIKQEGIPTLQWICLVHPYCTCTTHTSTEASLQLVFVLVSVFVKIVQVFKSSQ